MTPETAYGLLHRLDLKARAGRASPGGHKGLLFRLDGREMIMPMLEVAEIVPPPPLSRVPGARAWVLGVGNLHGDLLPVFDLGGFVLGRPTHRDERGNRVLVIEREGGRIGLLVEAMLGQRNYPDEPGAPPPVAEDPAGAWFSGTWGLGGQVWPVFGVRRMLESAAFRDIAA